MLIYGQIKQVREAVKEWKKEGKKCRLRTYNGLPPRGTQELNRCGKTRE